MTNSHVISFDTFGNPENEWQIDMSFIFAPGEVSQENESHVEFGNPEHEWQIDMAFLSIRSEIQKMNDKIADKSFIFAPQKGFPENPEHEWQIDSIVSVECV